MPLTIDVQREGNGERIDRFLSRHLAETSRSAIQKKIAAGSVLLNGRVVKAHHPLRTGDRVTVKDDEARERPLPVMRDAPEPTVLFENETVLVIDKPSGLTVHPGAGARGPTLVDWLRMHVPSIASVGDDPAIRPGIVHRLDRDVSGVMVIAKTRESFENLKRQFQDREIEKEYVALVHGIPTKERGIIDLRIGRSKRLHGKMTTTPFPDEGRDAITRFSVERHVRNNALLRVVIETGRTHQIRVHLKAIGHPIVGDGVYTTKPHRRQREDLARPFLHASRLSFTDTDGTKRSFEAPLPEALRRFIAA